MKSKNSDALAMGHAIRGAIAQADLTQAEAADRAGMAINTFSRRINGLTPFTWPEIVALAAVTQVTVAELVASAQRIANREQVVV